MVAAVRARPDLAWVFDEASPAPRARLGKLLLAGLAAAAVSPAIAPALLLIRLKEWLDSPAEDHVISDDALELMAREDLQVQNQLTHVVPVRPGLVRSASLGAVLAAIDFLARNFYDRGNLGGIASIHFARWAYIEDGQRLLFFSNYDGSWESYLGDFIDRAHVGLTSVWSNTQGFPKTVFLLFKGATDEERFKAWTRAYQVPTQLWYSAYPQLTVDNILVNRKVCEGLRATIDTERHAREWLALF